MQKRLIGIDGGGTKTDAVLCTQDGVVLNRHIGAASSPTSRSRESVKASLTAVLTELLSPHGGLKAEIDSVFAGISGCGLPENHAVIEACLNGLLPHANVVANGSDSINAISCVLEAGDGLVAICGTGSSVFARVNGVMQRIGGWGFLLGDEGSAYDMGCKALRAVLRAHDGRGQATLLTQLCARQLQRPAHECIEELYQDGRTRIAAFAPCLVEAAENGDAVATALIDEAANDLCETIRTAGRLVNLPVRPVAEAGSVWQPGGYYERLICKQLGEGYQLLRPQLPPVYGAAVEAARLAGLHAGHAFRTAFAASMKRGGN